MRINGITSARYASIDCSKPYYNNILIISPEFLSHELSPMYYGDTVTIGFYRFLGLEIGDLSSPTWSLTPGYKYIYSISKRIFSVYDDVGNLLLSKNNIKSVGDMGISFEIYKSHQFILAIDFSSSKYPFYIPVVANILRWGSYNVNESEGILNYYHGDTSRPYSISDVDNPSLRQHYVDGYVKITSGRSRLRNDFYGIGDIVDYEYLTKSDIYFINKILDPLVICNIDFIDRTIMHDWKKESLPPPIDDQPSPYDPENYHWLGTIIDISYLLPCWSISLYPDLMPIKMSGETINNRPVYEPWMIWQIMFITSRNITDEVGDHEVIAFDLSPNWG